MADLATTIAGALQQAGLHDPQMIASITQSVMGQLPQQQPGGPAWSGAAPSAQFGYEGQPDRDLVAGASFGRGPGPAPLDPGAPQDIAQGVAAEQGWQPFSGGAPQMMPPGSPAMGPGVTASPPSGAGLLAADALSLHKPAAPGVRKSGSSAPQKGGTKRGLLSDADRLNWQQVAAHGGQVPAAIRSLLASGA